MAERVPIALELTCITYSFFLLWPTLVNTNVDCEQSTPSYSVVVCKNQ